MKTRLFKSVSHVLLLSSLLAAFLVSQPATLARAAGAGSLPARPLMTVNGWSALGTGLNNGVRVIAINGTDIYAAGIFTDAGDSNGDRIAKWTGSAWQSLGSGISNGQVNSLAFNGSNLYVGGTFTGAGGVSGADYIAQWDGAIWSTLGDGLNGAVNAISVTGPDIYVAGDFTHHGISDPKADYIAKLDGGNWVAVGQNPLNGAINAIAVAGSTVYAGGAFTNFGAGGNSNLKNIAVWDADSQTWNALYTGLSSNVFAVTLMNGDLYVGGAFSDAGGDTNADRIAKWDGANWSALGSGWNSAASVNAIAASGSKLYVGGNFTDVAGNSNLDYIARWDGSSWSALGTTALNSPVSAILINGLDLYAGGTFTNAGGVGNANRIALFQIDATAPAVNSFAATSPTNSLNIPITAFTSSDNIAVTGWKITESNTPPATGDTGWTASHPTTYTVASSGSYSLYPWVKDGSANVSAVFGGAPVNVTVDATKPTVTAFSAPSSSASLDIPITTFTASDNVGVTGYLITESSSVPSAGAAGWTGSAPDTYTVLSAGSYSLYPWAKDALGNVSVAYTPASVNVDLTVPSVDSFAAPSSSTSLTISSISFTASDNVGVTGYLITESSTSPSLGDPNWTGSAPTSYTVASSGCIPSTPGPGTPPATSRRFTRLSASAWTMPPRR